MKVRHLEHMLSSIPPFESPVIALEQYPTSAHLAARMMNFIQEEFDGLRAKSVIDLGCGTGMLTAAAVYQDASFVMGVDIDEGAINQCRSNMKTAFDGTNVSYDILHADVLRLPETIRNGMTYDTVVMNPPFGTRKEGIDLQFVKVALTITDGNVFSLHKTSTRQGIERLMRLYRTEMEVVAQLTFDLPASYKHHSRSSVDIDVDLIRFWKSEDV